MTDAPRRVVVVGSFNVDHIWTTAELPPAGATLSGRYASGPGGKGFNQAVAAVRAGAGTTFVCALGDDAGGQLARALAAADGIDLRDQRSPVPTGTAGIFVDAQGRNAIVIGPGANAALSTAFIAEQDAAIGSASVLLVQLESPTDSIGTALVHARSKQVTTILNPAPADAATSTELLALADLLTPNETELAALLTRHLGERIAADRIAELDNAQLHGLCRQLLPHGSVVVTLGAAGIFVSHPEHALRGDETAWYRIVAERVEALDTTGAGDAFNGALAAKLAREPDAAFAAHVRFANRYAALSTECVGAAASMPHVTEVRARFGSG